MVVSLLLVAEEEEEEEKKEEEVAVSKRKKKRKTACEFKQQTPTARFNQARWHTIAIFCSTAD